jgi:hypothetical protein
VNLVKSIVKIYSQGFYRNLFHIFLSLIVFSMYFRSSYEFLEFLKKWENGKFQHSVGPASRPEARHCWSGPMAILAYRPALAGAAVRAHGHHTQSTCDGAAASGESDDKE